MRSAGRTVPGRPGAQRPGCTTRLRGLGCGMDEREPVVTQDVVRATMRRVKDPELNLNIVDLGLVYEIDVDAESRDVHVQMTLTSPGCPSGPEIMSEAQAAIEGLEGVGKVDIELVWTPYWTPERIDPRLRAFLGG